MAAKAIFITGGASGIGRAVAEYFAAKGWRIGLADIDVSGLAATQALLPDGMATTHVMDVRDRAQWVEALTAFTAASGGRLDVLFNNAGIAVGGPFAQTSAETLERCVAINFTGVVNGAHCGYPFLRATPGSCLLNTASAAGIYGAPDAAIYAGTKFAVRGLSESLDAEWARDGIRVRTIMPGFIDTPLLAGTVEGSNASVRQSVVDAGLEFTPLPAVAERAWAAVHGDKVHMLVGKTAHRMAFFARWFPGLIRRNMHGRAERKAE